MDFLQKTGNFYSVWEREAEKPISKYLCDKNFSAEVMDSLSSQSVSKKGHAQGIKTNSGEKAFTNIETHF